MRVRLALIAAALLAACSDSSDVVGPFSGPVQRYVIDRIDLPRDGAAANAVAADLDGDGMPENKLGAATAVLAATSDLSPNAADMIASGAITSVLEVQADDLVEDASVGVRYLGFEGADFDVAPVVFGGRVTGGAFISNRARDTEHPGAATAVLPVFVNAAPLLLHVFAAELDLVPDGAGGFDGVLRGGIVEREARDATHAGLVQMFETEPQRHLVFLRGVDEDHDDMLSAAEVDASIIGILVSADISLAADGMDGAISSAFAFHASPCAEGRCNDAVPEVPCRDRMRDGFETDIDCGGTCQRCAAGKACGVADDCQTGGCDAGVCRAPTCSDGLRDGYESDVDCGGVCPPCAAALACAADRDCASGTCMMAAASLGTCL